MDTGHENIIIIIINLVTVPSLVHLMSIFTFYYRIYIFFNFRLK